MDQPFKIIKITREFVDVIRSKREEAHFHDFEELVIVTEGSLEHYIDFQMEVIQAPAASYISMGKMHRVVERDDLRGWIINYQNEFIPDSKLNFYSNFMTSTSVQLGEAGCADRFVSLCEIINTEYSQPNPDMDAIRHLTSALISMIESERKRNIQIENTVKASQISTFTTFLRILEENFRRDEGVTFYAEKMNMSERNLNIICKSNFSKSVSEIIETRKLIEAKNLLIHTDKTVSEIGYDLGYNEKSYFTRVFRNKLSITPTEFREITRAILS
ncbi:MAG TPA: helix-turn-helix transcriptional regulator [Paludibacter sp.]|nr:helix-turn-helix transcriptional regulator [Paludibacter sp.]